MKSIKKLPFFIKGIVVVMLAAVCVSAAAAGLRIMEEQQQKPRVIKAVASLFASLADERYETDSLLALLQSDSLVCEGKLAVRDIREELVEQRFQFLLPYLKNTSTDYVFRRDKEKKQADFQIKAALHGVVPVHVEGYVEKEEAMVHIPNLHENWLVFSTDNLKAQYESSLLHSIMGETLSLPEKNLTEYLFYDIGMLAGEKKELFGITWQEGIKLVGELYQDVTVTKKKQKEEILFDGSYESCSVYDVTLPTEQINRFLKDTMQGENGYTLSVKEPVLPLTICLDNKKRILKLELEGTIVVNEWSIPLTAAFYPKGVENPWDSVLTELSFVWEEIRYGLQIVRNYEFSEEGRVLHISLSLTQPYVMQLFAVDVSFEGIEKVAFDFDISTPMASMDGICAIRLLEESVEKPKEEAIRVFELNFFELLRFTNGLNWNFFKKQE